MATTTLVYENLPSPGGAVTIPMSSERRTSLSGFAVVLLIGGIIALLVWLVLGTRRKSTTTTTTTTTKIAAAAAPTDLERCIGGCYSYQGVAPGATLSCERDCKRQYTERAPVNHTRPPLIASGERRAQFTALSGGDARFPLLFVFSPTRMRQPGLAAVVAAAKTTPPRLLYAVNARLPFVPLMGTGIVGPLAGTDYYAIPLPVETLQTMQPVGDRIEVAVDVHEAAAPTAVPYIRVGSYTYRALPSQFAEPGPYSCARLLETDVAL